MAKKYSIEGRLEDVLALIQVLALHEYSHRSSIGLKKEIKKDPISAKDWLDVANEHQEFFRVVEEKTNSISLVARHHAKDENNDRQPLSSEQTQTLLNTAIELHDRQLRRESRWAVLIPIWVAVIGGIFTILKLLIESDI